MQNMIRAYGDFNNDLRTDYVAIDNQNRTVVYLFNTDTYIFEQNTPVYPPVQGCNPLNYYLCKASLRQMTLTETTTWT